VGTEPAVDAGKMVRLKRLQAPAVSSQQNHGDYIAKTYGLHIYSHISIRFSIANRKQLMLDDGWMDVADLAEIVALRLHGDYMAQVPSSGSSKPWIRIGVTKRNVSRLQNEAFSSGVGSSFRNNGSCIFAPEDWASDLVGG
jgi:hypothetical protein